MSKVGRSLFFCDGRSGRVSGLDRFRHLQRRTCREKGEAQTSYRALHQANETAELHFYCRIGPAVLTRNEGRVFAMAHDSRKYGVAWVVAGLGAGAVAGFLYAPKTGRKNREDNGDSEDTEY